MRVCVSRTENPIGVPYMRQEADSNSHSYVDLRQSLEQISLIPEIRDWPELETTLRDINRAGSRFQTLGCEKSEIRPNDGSYGVSGYVDIAFEDLTIAKQWDFHVRLFQIFQAQAVTRWPDAGTCVEFVMQPTHWIELQQQSWSFSVWVIVGNCRSTIEAKERWSAALKVVREFLLANETFGLITAN